MPNGSSAKDERFMGLITGPWLSAAWAESDIFQEDAGQLERRGDSLVAVNKLNN
jgi:hypothetical protein